MEELRQNPKCKDFIRVLYGFVYTGKKTENYTRERLRQLHQKIYRLLAGLPRCQAQCSSVHKLNFNKWCETCSKWKEELTKVNRSRGIAWEKTESWKWPESYENIANVFLPSEWVQPVPLHLSDVSTQCHIWQRCREFHLNKTTVNNVRAARNDNFHRSSFRVTDTEKAKAFDALKDVIKDHDIVNDIDEKECLNELNKIDKDELFSCNDESVLEKIVAIVEERQGSIERRINEICDHLIAIREENQYPLTVIKRLTPYLHTFGRSFKTVLKYPKHLIVITFLLFIFVYVPRPNPFQDRCVEENYSLPWEQDLPLLEYVHDTNTLVGREWLFKILNEKLLQHKSSHRGIVSIAEFGYGKSAIVSHMLCAKLGEKGRILKESIAAFHICKYDVSSTQSPERFIRRLVGFFAMKIPEYGNIISLMSSSSILYDDEKCAKEQEACFDQAFRIPFKTITTEYSTMLVIIDALDECFHLTKTRNFILDLISTRIQYFPSWIKFFITSRDMVDLTSLQRLERLNLLGNASNNIKDIASYIKTIYNERPRFFNSDIKDALIENSEGNFLYIIHALQYIQRPDFNGTLPKLPFSLTNIYELNFDRQFQRGTTYSIARLILEIICTSLTPQNKKGIYEILKNSEAINMSYNDLQGEFVKLSYFIKADDGVILRHKALHSWLVESAFHRYRITLSRGHELISKHLLRTLKQDGTADILALVIHLSNSKNVHLKKLFYSFNMAKVLSFNEKDILHHLISKTDSEEALDLLLFHHSSVDVVDENKVSPAFLAASKGHLGQLKVLMHKGANVNFVVNPCRRCKTKYFLRDFKKDLDEIKTMFYSGYGLLHIAVQHGNTDITKYLIEETNIEFNLENVLGQRPIDIACEIGNIDIVKMFMSRGSNVIGDKCLYFATRNSHSNIVKQILDSGYKPSCISNETANMEFSKIMQPCDCDDEDSSHSPIKPLDTWWIALRETPLHYAIRLGDSRIAKFIARKAEYLLKCVDSYGYTPFLLAVKHKRYQLTKMLQGRANKDNCFSSASFLNREDISSNGTIIHEKGEDICPEGATFAHIIAIDDRRTNMIEIFENDTSLDWNKMDSSGNKPVHYATRHSNTMFIQFVYQKFGRTAFEENSENGSTAYHSAAISCSEVSLIALTNGFSYNITDFRDKCNRSVLQYALMCENKKPSYFPLNNLSLRCQIYLLKRTNVSKVDCKRQNILHYILRYGHDELLTYLQEKYPLKYKCMLQTKDSFMMTPIRYTIHHVPDVNDKVFSATLNQLKNESINTQTVDIKRTLHPWEMCLIEVVMSISPEETNNLILGEFVGILVKSPFLSKAVLLHYVFDNASYIEIADVKAQIINSITWAKHLNRERILTHSLRAISDVRPSLLLNCGQSLGRSPLHYFAFAAPLTISYDNEWDLLDVIKHIFNETKDKKDLHCSTSDGLNLLHYSILGGFLNLTDFFVKEKLSSVNGNVSVVDILHMAVFSNFKENIANNYAIVYSLLDRFVSNFIKERKLELKATDFCSDQSSDLSLVHFFAINGMNRSIKIVGDLFGFEVIQCRNIHNFTPLFFAEMFGRKYIEEIIVKDSSHNFPDTAAVEFLLLNIFNNFPQMKIQNPFRCMTSRRMIVMHERILIQNYRCLKSFYEIYFLNINDVFIHNIVYAREGVYLTGKLVVQFLEVKKYYLESIKSKCLSNCNKFIRALMKIKETLNELELWSGIHNGYLFWQSEFFFLKNIYNVLHLPFDKTKLSLSQTQIKTDCSTLTLRHVWHTFLYIKRILRTVVQNMQDLTVLVALFDQKSFIRVKGMFYKFNGLEPNIIDFAYNFEFSECHKCSFQLHRETMYNINRFRYLNFVKSTTTYKHIDSLRLRYALVSLSKSEFDQISKKKKFLHKMMHKTKKRQKWLLTNLKSELYGNTNGNCKCSASTENEDDEKRKFYTIRLPLI